MKIRQLNKYDLDECFALRLRALENSPDAFLTTLEEEKLNGAESFKARFAESDATNVIFGAVSDASSGASSGDKVVAMLGLFQEKRPKISHRSKIWGVFVDSEHRGQGLAGQLLQLAIEHAKKLRVRSVSLTVESENKGARRLYEAHGFVCWGTEPRAMAADGRFFSEDHLQLQLD